MYIGITQSKTSSLLELALKTAGLSLGESIVLFGGQFLMYESLTVHQHTRNSDRVSTPRRRWRCCAWGQ